MRGIKAIRRATAAAVAVAVSLAVAAPASALKLKYVEQTATANPNSVATVDAFCPEKYKVTGGGPFAPGGYEQNKIQDSYPIDGNDSGARPDDGWRASLWNDSALSANVTSQAICAKNLKLKNKRRLISPGSSDEPPTCSQGYSATGGGIDTAGTFASPVNVISSRPSDGTDENKKAESWFASAETGTGPVTATTHVMCAKNEDVKLKYESESFTVIGEDQDSAETFCDEDEQVVGAGGAANSTGAALVSILSREPFVHVTVDNFNATDIFPESYAVCAKDKKN